MLRELPSAVVVQHPPGAGSAEREEGLTRREARALKNAALRDPLVRRLTKGSRVKASKAVEWTNEGATRRLGAGVTLKISPPVDLERQPLPIYLEPNPKAPPNTPDLRRKIVYTATGVSEMKARVLLAGREVVLIEPGPFGRHFKVTEARLIGPDPGADYISEGD